jgi:ABC-type nitrate/sulfonate/bicarbonate transport system substrate-binding protein
MRTAIQVEVIFVFRGQNGMAAQKRNLIIIAVIILVIAIVVSSFVYLNIQKPYIGNVETITLGVYPSEYNSLIYIAKDQQYFAANGLNVTLKEYPSGATAVRGMINGEVEVSTASEFVVANNVMQKAKIWAIGSTCKYLNQYVVARTDKGISSVSDLEGKKIGVSLGTAQQFYLGRYLELNGVDQSQVTLVNVNFAEAPNALANGNVDAVITFQPYINEIQSLLGNKTMAWSAQADQFGYFGQICTQDWGATHSDLIVRFLKALVQAQNFNLDHPNQAIDLVAKDLNYTNSYINSVWSDYQFSVTLDQSFIVLLQDEARWLISNNLTNATAIPNFSNYVYTDGLKSVNPGAVNIIG